MFISIQDKPQAKVLSVDLCIVGAGPAGITLARQFVDKKMNVCLIESGDLEYQLEAQKLNEGVTEGSLKPNLLAQRRHQDAFSSYLKNSRVRQFGGASAHWAGYCLKLREEDFKKKEWLPLSGWPLTKAALDPFYKKALQLCQVQEIENDDEQTNRLMNLRWILKSPPTHFGITYRKELEEARNIHIYLNSTCTSILLDASRTQVKEVLVRSNLDRQQNFKIRANVFVLASGGVENARLLLSSNSQISRGIGNEFDQVGRYFMEHPESPLGEFFIWKPSHEINYFQNRTLSKSSAFGILSPSSALKEKEQILDFSVQLRFNSSPAKPLEEVNKSLSFYTEESTETTYGNLFLRSEQEPRSSNRITLDTTEDQFGVPRSKLSWELSGLDKKTIERSCAILGWYLGQNHLGRAKAFSTTEMRNKLTGQSHQMGTTRMSSTPKDGVVDPNTKVHGIHNLFICGSSVFPTSGSANPTLTILALSLKLGEHLNETYFKV